YLTAKPGGFPTTFQNGLLFVFVILGLIYYGFFRRKISKIRIPGPGMKNILGGLTNVLALSDKRKTLQVLENWCATYGPIFTFCLGPHKGFALNSPEYIQKLLSSTKMGHPGKGFAYKPFQPYLQDGLILSKDEKWKFRRRVLEKHMFSFKTLRSFMATLNKETDNFLHKIGVRVAYETEQRIDDILMSYSIEVITSAAFGKTVADMESMTDCKLNSTDTVNRAKEIIVTRCYNPWLLSYFIWRFHSMSKIEKGVLKSMKIIGDTTLKENPNIPGQKRGEGIKHVLAAAGQLQFRALRELKYLEVCVNETLRLLPTVFFYMRKIEKPLKLGNFLNFILVLNRGKFSFSNENLVLDAGSDVEILVQGLHKNPEYFPNPQKFIPEREGDQVSTCIFLYSVFWRYSKMYWVQVCDDDEIEFKC
ncbi:Cytochrome P450 4C1, partial [Orchesella cincta]